MWLNPLPVVLANCSCEWIVDTTMWVWQKVENCWQQNTNPTVPKHFPLRHANFDYYYTTSFIVQHTYDLFVIYEEKNCSSLVPQPMRRQMTGFAGKLAGLILDYIYLKDSSWILSEKIFTNGDPLYSRIQILGSCVLTTQQWVIPRKWQNVVKL